MNNAFTVALRAPVRANSVFPSTLRFSVHRFFSNAIRTELSITPLWRLATSKNRSQLQEPQYRRFSKYARLQVAPRRPPRLIKPSSSSPPNAKRESPQTKRSTSNDWTKHWKTLDEAQLKQVFGTDISSKKGNFLLAELQHRRISGSLAEEGLTFPQQWRIDRDEAERGLVWLRGRFPMDEEAAAVQWAEQEADRLEEEERKNYESRGQRYGLYKKEEGKEIIDNATIDRTVDSRSVLVQRQQEMKREREEREKRRQAQKAAVPSDPTAQAAATTDMSVSPWAAEHLSKLDLAREERRRYTAHKAQEAEIETEKIFAKRSALSRLLPSTLFAIFVVYACYLFSESYSPPPQSVRLLPQLPPALATFILLFNINALIFTCWRLPSAWKILNRFFMLSAGHPRVFSVLGNVFSHQQLSHFLANMAMLYFVGAPVHDMIGRGNFIAMYLSTGVLSSLGSLYWHVLTKHFVAATVGASGALFGILGCFFGLQERGELVVPFFPELRFEYDTRYVAGALVAMEVCTALVLGRHTPIDHVAHIAGILSGFVAGRLLKARAAKEEEGDWNEGGVTE